MSFYSNQYRSISIQRSAQGVQISFGRKLVGGKLAVDNRRQSPNIASY